MSSDAVVALATVTCSIATFFIGWVLGMLCWYCIMKYKRSDQTPAPQYEDVHQLSHTSHSIDLKDNVAYEQSVLR